MVDNVPVVSEFHNTPCTCSGAYTGCAVCSVASTLKRYSKPVPSSMRSLGSSMGLRHRRAVTGNRHGLSLTGICSPPHSGTNWCAYCAKLELAARGLNVGYAHLTDGQIASHLKAGHSLIVPGLYARVPIVSRSSYSGTEPAKGRSDSNFDSWHMVAAHGVKLVGTTIVSVLVADSDFGSASRPIMPPHSEWSWAVFLSFYHATGGWGITYVNSKPAATAPPPPTVLYRAHVNGAYFEYIVNKDGVVIDRIPHNRKWSANCSPAMTLHWPAEHRSVRLVQIRDSRSAYNKTYIGSKYSDQ